MNVFKIMVVLTVALVVLISFFSIWPKIQQENKIKEIKEMIETAKIKKEEIIHKKIFIPKGFILNKTVLGENVVFKCIGAECCQLENCSKIYWDEKKVLFNNSLEIDVFVREINNGKVQICFGDKPAFLEIRKIDVKYSNGSINVNVNLENTGTEIAKNVYIKTEGVEIYKEDNVLKEGDFKFMKVLELPANIEPKNINHILSTINCYGLERYWSLDKQRKKESCIKDRMYKIKVIVNYWNGNVLEREMILNAK